MKRAASQLTKRKRKAIHVEFVLVDGIDDQNHGEDTIVDITAYPDMKLSEAHAALLKILQVDSNILPFMQYSFPNTTSSLDIDQTMEALGIQEGDRIVVDASRKKKKLRVSDFDTEDTDEDLTIICYTRIFEADGMPMKRLKILVKRQQSCAHLLEDVSKLWNRDNLKFRYGRHVLTSDKTFADVGMVDMGEVLVTGARG